MSPRLAWFKSFRWHVGDTLAGCVVTGVFLLAFVFRWGPTEVIENKLYDLRLRHAPRAPWSEDLALVAIDETSIRDYGRWPWPRSLHALLLSRVAGGGPRVIGFNILYADPDSNQGLETVQELKKSYGKLVAEQERVWAPLVAKIKDDRRYKQVFPANLWGVLRRGGAMFDEAAVALDNDGQLVATLQAIPGVVLPMLFSRDISLSSESGDLQDRLRPYCLKVSASPAKGVEGYDPLLPLPLFAREVSGLGHVNLFPDFDGVVRREAPVVRCDGAYYPSFSLEMTRLALGLDRSQIKLEPGKSLTFGKRTIPLAPDNTFLVRYPGPLRTVPTVSAGDLLSEHILPSVLKDKVVLVGLTAVGLGGQHPTPYETLAPSNGFLLAAVNHLLKQSPIQRPPWAPRAEFIAFLLAALGVLFLLPRLRAVSGALTVLAGLVLILGGGASLFILRGWSVRLVDTAGVWLVGYLVLVLRRLMFTERRQEKVEKESIETNRLLGLSFQGQGMLDMAFEKFRRCPLDDGLKDLLYNLALDFERKRQFAKAVVVYDHIATQDPQYKDISARRRQAQSVHETGFGPAARREGTVVLDGSSVKPTLGRYEIEKELGRGAMGVVYLGRDPRINRLVALKTMRFEDDADEESSRLIRERFFREAESAGTLSHPNIVRIFDAGEDHDVAYIAMELLEGEDLKKHVEKSHWLPVEKVVESMALVADALDYAHSHGVVHRDIKPANIMLLKDDTLRVTDFGIARLAATSKTQTGTVLGTPSYMSPEQVAGKKVDGRADLFSLGVTLYELLTGAKPFEGDSIATLLYHIANEPPLEARMRQPGRVSLAVSAVIEKALRKDSAERYQSGADMARDLRAALKDPFTIPAGAILLKMPSVGPTPPPPPSAQAVPPAPPPAADTTPQTPSPPPEVPQPRGWLGSHAGPHVPPRIPPPPEATR